MNESDKTTMGGPAPSLTLDPFTETREAANQMPKAPVARPEEKVFDTQSLTPEEQQMITDFAKTIDITDAGQVMQYGAGAQKKIADFSDTALESVRTQDLGEVGETLTQAMVQLKSFDVSDKKKGFFSNMFKKGSAQIEGLKAQYAKAETNVNKICDVLEGHQVQLLKDISMMDQLYELNKTYFKELSMYILAGKQKLQEVQTVDLPALIQRSKESGLPEDVQAASDLAAMCNRFEKKLHDLELTRVVSMQMAPQIRLVQNNDTLMAEKIQSSLVNTIPLWKSQMVLAMGVAHSTEAARAQNEVTNMTNELLRKNAQTLKMNTIETAKESEKGIVDIQVLKETNKSLIDSFDEVLKIQEDGRKKRQEAEVEMARIENDLKEKMLEISRRKTV